MFGQSFTVADLPVVATLTFLEVLLSADNALVLAILVRHLNRKQQPVALFYGLAAAFVLRATMIVLATWLMKFWWIEAAGGAYLLYLAAHYFVRKSTAEQEREAAGKGFWPTVGVIALTDLAFAIDSILAAVALADTARHSDKIWVVYLGGILGVAAMGFVANVFIRLLERFPRLETSAYLIIGWIAVKLGMGAYGHYVDTHHPADLMTEQEQHAAPMESYPSEDGSKTFASHEAAHIPHMPPWAFWPVTVGLFAYGFLPEKGKRHPEPVEGKTRDEPPVL